MVEIGPELVQVLGLFCGLGALYGGIRGDLKRLHEQSALTMRLARSARRRIRKHLDRVGKRCPHAENHGANAAVVRFSRRCTDQDGDRSQDGSLCDRENRQAGVV